MKILHFELDENVGGIEKFIINNFSELQKDNKIEFYYVTSKRIKYAEECGINDNVIKIPPIIFLPFYCFKIIQILSNDDYDVIHFHKNSLCNSIAIYLAKIFTSAKVVIHAHNTRPKGVSGVFSLVHYINKFIINNMDVVRIACSNEARRYFWGDNKAIIIYNGINFANYIHVEEKGDYIKKIHNIDDNALVLGDVAALIAQKNITFLIDVVKKLSKEINVYLIIVGDGGEATMLKRYVKESGLENKVIFTGSVNNVKEYLDAMDIYVMPSLYEGLPISAIEAQVNGLPCVFSENIDRMVKISETVKFLPINSVDIWCEEVKRLKPRSNSLICDKAQKYSISNSVKELRKIYE